MRDWEWRHQADLLSTLKSHVESGAKVDAIGRKMGLHRGTVHHWIRLLGYRIVHRSWLERSDD